MRGAVVGSDDMTGERNWSLASHEMTNYTDSIYSRCLNDVGYGMQALIPHAVKSWQKLGI